MKTPILIIAFLFSFAVCDAFAQLKSMESSPVDTTLSLTSNTLLESPSLFQVKSFLYFDKDVRNQISILDRKLTDYALFFGRSILANKNDFGSFQIYAPRTVSQYNRQVSQLLFMAEPTSQERRSISLFGRY